MASDADYLYEKGYTSTHGGIPSFCYEGDESEPEPTWFATAKEALDYAKKRPDIIVRKSDDGSGFNVVKSRDSFYFFVNRPF